MIVTSMLQKKDVLESKATEMPFSRDFFLSITIQCHLTGHTFSSKYKRQQQQKIL